MATRTSLVDAVSQGGPWHAYHAIFKLPPPVSSASGIIHLHTIHLA